jgi:membrane dipeptidase
MNRLGIMIDVSHVSDDTFEQVVELSRAPLIASHSSCRHFTPGWERNMSDEMIRKLAARGGVIQLNFGSGFLTAEAQAHNTEMWKRVKAFREERGIPEGEDHPDVKAFRDAYLAEHPLPYAGLADVVAHVDHVVELAGVDHVGFGSDFEGVGDSLPTGLKSVADYPNLIAALLAAGYGEEDLRKICGENLLRVWAEVERVARELEGAAGGP